MTFVKGQSGNPHGRAKVLRDEDGQIAQVTDYARKYARLAVKELVRLLKNGKTRRESSVSKRR